MTPSFPGLLQGLRAARPCACSDIRYLGLDEAGSTVEVVVDMRGRKVYPGTELAVLVAGPDRVHLVLRDRPVYVVIERATWRRGLVHVTNPSSFKHAKLTWRGGKLHTEGRPDGSLAVGVRQAQALLRSVTAATQGHPNAPGAAGQ